MSTQLSRQMILLNQTDKMLNDLYHTYAASVHLSDSVLWVLYILWTEGDGLTQKEICDTWYYSRQTINTCLKHLEKEGYICLAPLTENRKSKQILFTKEGRNFAGKIIPPLLEAENASLDQMTPEEQECLIMLSQKRTDLLRTQLLNIEKTERHPDGHPPLTERNNYL